MTGSRRCVSIRPAAGNRVVQPRGVVAERAGVAVQTLYFLFHTKDEFLQAVHEWTVLTDDPTPPPLQGWYVAAMAEPDARRAVAMLIEGSVTIESRVAPMIPAFHAVSADPAGEIYRRAQILRRQGMEDCIDALSKKARLRPGLTRRRAVDPLYTSWLAPRPTAHSCSRQDGQSGSGSPGRLRR